MQIALQLDWIPIMLAIIGGIATCGGLRYFIVTLAREQETVITSRNVQLAMYTSLIWNGIYITIISPDNYSLWLVYAWLCMLLIYIDSLFLLLPRILIWPLGILGVFYQSVYEHSEFQYIAISALCSYMAMAFFYYAYWWLVKKPGMGYGDIRLTVALGIWTGYEYLSYLLMLAAVFAIMYIVAYSIVRKKLLHTCPFGPFLCMSATLLLTYRSLN